MQNETNVIQIKILIFIENTFYSLNNICLLIVYDIRTTMLQNIVEF